MQPKREIIDLNQAQDKDQFVMIRGYPRKKEYIRELEQRHSAKLVPDSQPDLLKLLDNALIEAKMKTGKWPDYLALEREPFKLFIAVPYEIEFVGLQMMMYQKPAWFSMKRTQVVLKPSWSK
jgi:hypothetical protein